YHRRPRPLAVGPLPRQDDQSGEEHEGAVPLGGLQRPESGKLRHRVGHLQCAQRRLRQADLEPGRRGGEPGDRPGRPALDAVRADAALVESRPVWRPRLLRAPVAPCASSPPWEGGATPSSCLRRVPDRIGVRAMRFFALLPPILLNTLSATAAAPERPSVVLVTLDTTRADRMGFLGSTRGLTPALDTLAREAVVFDHAYAQAPIPTASHATILSGTYPQLHKVNDFGIPLPESLPWLPDLLRASGYATAAFVGSLILDPRNGLAPGFDRGFDVYDAGFRARRGKENRYDTLERRGEDVVGRALTWLGRRAPGPFFLWVHLYDAHDPYEPPDPFGERFAKAPYDGEIAYADAQVGRLLAALKASGTFGSTIVAV